LPNYWSNDLGQFFKFCRNLPVIWRRIGINELIQFFYQNVVMKKGGIAGMMFLQTA